jgi:hypothetical protein
MPETLIPSRWTSQPQYPVELSDWAKSIGIVAAWIPGVTKAAAGIGQLCDTQSGTFGVSSVGKFAATTAGTATTSVKLTDSSLLNFGTGDFAIGFLVRHAFTDSGTRTLLARYSGSGNNYWLGQNSLYWNLSINGTNSGAPADAHFDITSNANKWRLVSGTRRAALSYTQVDGRESAGVSATTSVDATGFLRAGAFGDSGSGFSAAIDVAMAFACRRGLTLDQHTAIYRNPWILFRPQTRRIFFDVAGTAGVTGTAAITEVGDTASASGKVGTTGTASVTETADTAAASGKVGTTGTAAVTETADTPAATGTVGNVGLTGTAAITETADVAAASGKVGTVGTSAITETADTPAATGIKGHVGSAAVTEGADIVVSAGTVVVAVTLTTADIEAIWAFEIEPGVSAKVAMQRLLAVMGGKVSGAGTGTETFRDINDTRDALVSINDASGNRTSLTWSDGA